MFFCHSERAFGRGRIPAMSKQVRVINLLGHFIYDTSKIMVAAKLRFPSKNISSYQTRNPGFNRFQNTDPY